VGSAADTARSPGRARPSGKQQLGQQGNHRPLPYHAPTRASSWMKFSGGAGGCTSHSKDAAVIMLSLVELGLHPGFRVKPAFVQWW
jgi:hypothetical protein